MKNEKIKNDLVIWLEKTRFVLIHINYVKSYIL